MAYKAATVVIRDDFEHARRRRPFNGRPGEAAELLDLTRPAAVTVLQTLEDSGFLALTLAGRFG